MNQTIISNKEGPLLTYAISKLRAGVFSHPVWVRFSNKDKAISPETIRNLFIEADHLQSDNPGDACQVLLICAFYQNYSGQRSSALATLQKAMDLAEQNGLSQEILWAIWGSCAICVQRENYEEAAMHFGHLQAALYEQNEWMLADFIDVVRQFFPGSGLLGTQNDAGSIEGQDVGALLTSTVDWLYGWGLSARSNEDVPFDGPTGNASAQELIPRSFPPARGQQGPWHTLKLMFRGEVKLHWQNVSLHTKSKSSFLGAILSSLRLYFLGQKIDDQVVNAVPLPSSPSTSDKVTEYVLPDIPTSKPEAESKNKSIKSKHPPEHIPSVISVSVHMLGKFEMSIQDVALKLSASRSLSVLKYLLLNHKQNTPREVLMDVFWPDADSETARNNLNVALHGIRRALHGVTNLPVILYRDGAYYLAPETQIWLDVEEFERLASAGKRSEPRNQSAAVSEYEAAISIYQGDFLQENPYEEWTVLTREHLRAAYLDILDRLSQIYFNQERYAACITVCQRILSYDPCREDAYYLLMQCYSRQGQYHLALREYQNCVKALRAELEVEPAPETIQLYNRIRHREHV